MKGFRCSLQLHRWRVLLYYNSSIQNQIYETKEDVSTIREGIEFVTTAVEFAKTVRRIKRLKDTVTLERVEPKLIRNDVQLPELIKDVIEGFDALDDIVPAVRNIQSSVPKYEKMVAEGIPQLLRMVYRDNGNPRCQAVAKDFYDTYNTGRKLLQQSQGKKLIEILGNVKSIVKLRLSVNVEKFGHWVKFNIKKPRLTTEKICPSKFKKGAKLGCICVPKMTFHIEEFQT